MTTCPDLDFDIILGTSRKAVLAANPDDAFPSPASYANEPGCANNSSYEKFDDPADDWTGILHVSRSWSPAAIIKEGRRGTVTSPVSHLFGIVVDETKRGRPHVDLLAGSEFHVAVWNATGFGMPRRPEHFIAAFSVTRQLRKLRKAYASYADMKNYPADWRNYSKAKHETDTLIAERIIKECAKKEARDGRPVINENSTKLRGFATDMVARSGRNSAGTRIYVAGNCPVLFLEFDIRAVNAKGAGRKWYAWENEAGDRRAEYNRLRSSNIALNPGRAYAAYSGPTANWQLINEIMNRPNTIGIRRFDIRVAGGSTARTRRHITATFGDAAPEAALLHDVEQAVRSRTEIGRAIHGYPRRNPDGLTRADYDAACDKVTAGISSIVEGISRAVLTSESGRDFGGIPLTLT